MQKTSLECSSFTKKKNNWKGIWISYSGHSTRKKVDKLVLKKYQSHFSRKTHSAATRIAFFSSSCGWGSFASVIFVLLTSLRSNNTHLTLYWSGLGILRFPNLMHKLLIKPKMSKTTARPWRSSPGDLGKRKRSLFMNSERKTVQSVKKPKRASLPLKKNSTFWMDIKFNWVQIPGVLCKWDFQVQKFNYLSVNMSY